MDDEIIILLLHGLDEFMSYKCLPRVHLAFLFATRLAISVLTIDHPE
jgi:hypothetical protein